jgi:hypothetical protein
MDAETAKKNAPQGGIFSLAVQNLPHHKPPKVLIGKQIKHLRFNSSF